MPGGGLSFTDNVFYNTSVNHEATTRPAVLVVNPLPTG